ncbi:MAG: VCBS repeat-containing protein [Verrucomicrobia bacterium]|nr:VCBS repeat-containing protein [Verrucomicrobiota bacterium]
MKRYHFLTIGLVVFAFIFAQGAVGQTAMGPLRPEGMAMSDADAPQPVKVMVGEKGLPQYRVAPPANFATQPKTATFTIQYLNTGEVNYYGDVCVGWPEDAKAAFTYAANIWGTLLNSTVPIKISACWANMGTGGILGHGGARSYYKDFTSAPQASTYYPVAIANALYGSDLNGGTEEIVIAYNAQFTGWYYGTGTCPADKIDFVQVIMHEMCHGLGFIGSMSVSGSTATWGMSGYPTIYDRYTENGSGTKLITYTSGSAALYNQLISGSVYFNGANANAANGGAKVKLYAPSTWAQGSSYAHLDEIFNGTANAMMTYSVNWGETIHDPGTVTLGILKDNGWSEDTPTPPTTTGAINDYDGDGKTDYSLYGWMNGKWSIWSSYYGRFLANGDKWGGYRQLPVSGDFNGGGQTDIAVYSLDDGYWYIYYMETGTYSIFQWGGYGYCPVAGDYDGDGKTDFALYYWPTGYWYIWSSLSGSFLYNGMHWVGSDYIPVAGDFDGDGKADIAVYSEDSCYWYIYYTGTGLYSAFQWGVSWCRPACGDYDGDGKTDYALYYWPAGYWYIWSSLYDRYLVNGDKWGGYGYIPVTGDFNGGGIADIAVYSEDYGYWLIYYTETGLYSAFTWGGYGYEPPYDWVWYY